MIALIDHYDSFTYNIVYYLRDYPLDVFYPETIVMEDLKHYSHIIFSPGYGHPKNCSVALDILKYYHESKKILGICLGHQVIAFYFGSKIARLSQPCHGKASLITQYHGKLFRNLDKAFNVGRYHSLCVSRLHRNLLANCYSDDGVLMAFEHRYLPIFGVQFHPESILSECGREILCNFLAQ